MIRDNLKDDHRHIYYKRTILSLSLRTRYYLTLSIVCFATLDALARPIFTRVHASQGWTGFNAVLSAMHCRKLL
jgi:hypothetical protein